MKKFSLAMLICFFMFLTGLSEGAFEAKDYGARIAGMSSSGLAVDGDAFSIAYNPAHLALITNRIIGVSYRDLFGLGINQLSYSIVLPLSFITVGIMNSQVGDDIYKENTNLLSLSKELGFFSIGANLKNYKLASDVNGSGWGIDLGIIKKLKNSAFSISCEDLFSTLLYDTNTVEELEKEFKVGIAIYPNPQITMSFDLINKEKGSLALEKWYSDNIALRAGLSQQVLTAGLTVRSSFWQIDYAYEPQRVGSTHLITTSFFY
mgnify:CR=1 FL=1